MTATFSLVSDGHLTAEIIDLAGRRVATLASSFYRQGAHELVWDGCDGGGLPAATGTFLFRLQIEAESVARKVILAR